MIAAQKPRSRKPAQSHVRGAVRRPAAGSLPIGDLASAAAEAAALLKTLANPDRLLLLCSLVDGEANVSALETLTGIRQPTLSQQLGVLREEGIVETRRDGKYIYYRIASVPVLALLRTLYDTFCAPRASPPRRGRSSRKQEIADEH